MKQQNHVIERLPDYLLEAVSGEEKANIARHLKTCKPCKEEWTTLTTLWSELGLLPEEKPSEQLRANFYAELNRHKAELGRHHAPEHKFLDRVNALIERLWPKQPALQFAMALAFLLVGYVVGFRVDGGAGQAVNGDMAQLRNEVQDMQRLVMLSLLKTQSASERIQGVNWSERIEQPDQEVLGALFSTLNYDQNVNVRLAALESLTRFYEKPDVREGLMNALPKQTSPLIQLALVDVFVGARDTQAMSNFKELLQEKDLNPTVKERVEQRLQELGK